MPRKAGRGNPIITEEKVTDYLRQQEPPLAGTTQIAEQFDVARTSVIERLNTLQEKDVVGKVKVGQSFAWYLNEWGTVTQTSTTGGPGGGRPPGRDNKAKKEPSAQTKTGDLPGILIVMAFMFATAFVGWQLAKEAYGNVEGDKLRESAYGALTASFTSVAIGTPAMVMYYTIYNGSTIAGLFGVFMGMAGYLGMVIANGGFVGISAQAADRAISKIMGSPA